MRETASDNSNHYDNDSVFLMNAADSRRQTQWKWQASEDSICDRLKFFSIRTPSRMRDPGIPLAGIGWQWGVPEHPENRPLRGGIRKYIVSKVLIMIQPQLFRIRTYFRLFGRFARRCLVRYHFMTIRKYEFSFPNDPSNFDASYPNPCLARIE